MTGHIYRDVILEQHVRLFRGAMGAEFLFMDDNARPHRANIVDECLQSEDFTRMDWPAYSPDLNQIEHVVFVGFSRIFDSRRKSRRSVTYLSVTFIQVQSPVKRASRSYHFNNNNLQKKCIVKIQRKTKTEDLNHNLRDCIFGFSEVIFFVKV
ncbi:DDE_3 domain-containing protein [Trichonephila clavipes]|nr:DDE_3 domain-containing protein [Trichonephila clavipes]